MSDERLDLLAACTESKRLDRASKEAARVVFQFDGPDLYLASVSSYHVVVDAGARRVQHGCRDFLTESRASRLCKHVAAVLLAMEESTALAVLRGLADPHGDQGWHVEAMAARGFRG